MTVTTTGQKKKLTRHPSEIVRFKIVDILFRISLKIIIDIIDANFR